MQKPERKINEDKIDERYSDLSDAFLGKVVKPWASVPKWFVFPVYFTIVIIATEAVEFIFEDREIGATIGPWTSGDYQNGILWGAGVISLIVSPRIYQWFLKK